MKIAVTIAPARPDVTGWAPYRLVSLLAMLQHNASEFLTICHHLCALETAYTGSGASGSKVPEALAEMLIQTLDVLKEHCGNLQMAMTISQIERAAHELRGDRKTGIVGESFRALGERVTDELKGRMFLAVPPDKERYFQSTKEFAAVTRFSEMTADVEDAGWCLAIGRASAAVYHLMCVMEFGIRRLAKRLKVPRADVEHKTWGQIFKKLDLAVQSLPYTKTAEKARRDRFAEAMAHLNNVKDAWRNPSMHGRRRYTTEEAEAIFDNVKTFTNYLATTLLK